MDAHSRYDQITYATGATLKYSYDDQGRVITKRLTQPAQDGLEKVDSLTTYTYTGNRITQIRDPHQILTFKYNSQGKLHSRSILYTGLNTPITTYYKYDKMANRNLPYYLMGHTLQVMVRHYTLKVLRDI